MRISLAASRYAQALFELAVEKKAIEAIEEDMQFVASVLKENQDFAKILYHPRLSRQEKRTIVDEVFKASLENEYSLNFIYLLLEKQREIEIVAIYEKLKMLIEEFNEQLPVEVTVATPLADSELSKLTDKLEARTGKKLVLTVEVDPSIIGGVVIRYQDKVIDGSIRNRLHNLYQQIKAIPVAEMRGESV